KAARVAHVHQPGLDPALEPARALRQPFAEGLRPGFVCRQRDRLRAIAEAAQAQAENGVLCYGERVPAADLVEYRPVEMVRGSAERQHEFVAREERQHAAEKA